MSSIISTYNLGWKVYWHSWAKDWKTQNKAIEELGTHFQKGIPMTSYLMWNIIMYVMMEFALISVAAFSKDFQVFCAWRVLLPQLLGAVAYYVYKYGWQQIMTSLTWESFGKWMQNWWAMQGVALVSVTHVSIIYLLAIPLQPYVVVPVVELVSIVLELVSNVLPHREVPQVSSDWDLSFRFPTDLYEESLRVFVYWVWGLFVVCTMTLPLWKRGYEISMTAAGRNNVTISYTETFMELLYTSCTGTSPLFTLIPLVVAMQHHFELRIYPMHVILALIEVILFNWATSYKFCVLHQLMHEIQPLYAMTHVEHHICKGIYPTTGTVGMWEPWLCGQGNLIIGTIGLAPIPHFVLQTVMGLNLLAHTMWPHPKLLQWHTLHHTILADVYNLNIPSPYDKEHSRSVSQLQSQLEKISPFVKYEWLSDLVAFAMMGVVGMILHYGFDTGIARVEWFERTDWKYYQQNATLWERWI